MADIVANISLAKWGYYAGLPAAADAFIVIPLETTGLVSDATLKDYDDVGTMLAGATNEQSTLGRKTVTSITVTVDDTNDRLDVTFADQTWTAGSGNPISKLCLAYDGDTGAGTDTNIAPISYHDFVVTPDGSDITADLPTDAVLRAS